MVVLSKAVGDAKGNKAAIVLTAVRDDEKQTFRVDSHGGEKYSVLQRNAKPDTLTTGILAPLH